MGKREILFRGKHIHVLPENKHLNGTWIYGYLCEEHYINSPELEGEFLIDPDTICRYTGLTDKNGRKIFEGDIVRDIFNGHIVGVVRYGEYRNAFNDDEYGGHVGFYVEWKEKQNLRRKDLVYWVKNSEFIGNIFDNTELLEGGGEKDD